MKKVTFCVLSFIFFLGILSPSITQARVVKVRNYYKPSTGTFVNSHYKTSPNSTKFDNYSTKGNYNPYTGKSGTVKNKW